MELSHQTLMKSESITPERSYTTLGSVARFAVAGRTRPLLTEAVDVGDQVRRALMSRSQLVAGNASSVFSGRDADGELLDDRHRHAHFLSEASKPDGRISHLNVFTLHDFTPDEERALGELAVVKYGGQADDLQFVLLGIGRPDDFGGLNDKIGQSRSLALATSWISRTPFVLSRHLKFKRNQLPDPGQWKEAYRQALVEVVRFELRQRDQFEHLADMVEIEPLLKPSQAGTRFDGQLTPWQDFHRERETGGGHRAGNKGFGFKLTFPEPVQGPIALGYASHFGLGQFVPLAQ